MQKYREQGRIATLNVKTQNLYSIRWMFFQNIELQDSKYSFTV